MGKGLRITMYAALIFLSYLWISTVFKSCTATEKQSQEEIYDYSDEDNEFEDDFFDEGLDSEESDEMGGNSLSSALEEEEEENSIDYTEVDEIIERSKNEDKPENIPSHTTTTKKAKSTKISNERSGKYLLLAGHYLMESNAKAMVKKLKKLGYSKAEVVVFDMSPYYSVCAGRFTGLSQAQRVSSKLKRKGIENYVHTKNR